MKTNFIFYVQDQERAKNFYETILGLKARLHVPGMTEFLLSNETVLGLMPEQGIKKLLGEKLKDPAEGRHFSRAEIYFSVANASEHLNRALANGARPLSPMEKRNWGDTAGYCLDLDNHVIAFAELHNPVKPVTLEIDHNFYLSNLKASDRMACAKHMNDPEIHNQTMGIPYPITPTDADAWITKVLTREVLAGETISWAIREKTTDEMIGWIGFFNFSPANKDFKAELGYFLSRSYWNKGIMSSAVKIACNYAFQKFQLEKIVGVTFSANQASAKVLLKSGFVFEGEFKRNTLKNDKILDSKYFALFKKP